MKSSSSDAGDPAEAERRRGRSHPSEKDEVVRAKRTESSPNPSDSNRPTESAKNNNVVRLGEREVLEHEDDKLIEEIARLHPQKLTKNIRRQWRGDLWALQVRHGMDAPRELLLPAIQNALLNAARSGRHVITPTTTLAGRFEKAALSLRDDLKGLGAADRAYWREQFAAQCEAVIAARSPPAPKPTDGDAWLDAITPAQVAECDAMFDDDTPAEKRRARDRERRLRLKQEKRNVEKS